MEKLTRNNSVRLLVSVGMAVLFLWGCDRTPMVTETIASEGIRRIADKRIFWGHQSVGSNIIAGIQEVVGEARSPGLNIQNTSLESQLNRPVFAHQRVGRNMDPVSKMSAFETLLKGGVGKTCDIAGLKFCYVDVGAKTDRWMSSKLSPKLEK